VNCRGRSQTCPYNCSCTFSSPVGVNHKCRSGDDPQDPGAGLNLRLGWQEKLHRSGTACCHEP